MELEDLKKQIDIIEIAREGGLKLKKQSRRIYRAKCFYHKDTATPNLTLYADTNTFKCYACGKHGDIFNLYADIKGISNKEAIKELKNRACPPQGQDKGLITPTSEFSAEKVAEPTKIYKKQQSPEALFTALKDFCEPLDQESLNYLTSDNRGLTGETIKKFNIFCIKSYRNAKEFLLRQGSLKELKDIGLFDSHNRFIFTKNRLIIPIIADGLIVSLRGRFFDKGITDPSEIKTTTFSYAKYISLKGVSGLIFNGDVLKTAKAGERVYLCEGEFDTMIMDQRGVKAVGLLGVSNFTSETANRLKDFEIVICFDNDQTGNQKALEVANALEASGAKHDKIIINTLPEGVKDITEYFVKKGRAK